MESSCAEKAGVKQLYYLSSQHLISLLCFSRQCLIIHFNSENQYTQLVIGAY